MSVDDALSSWLLLWARSRSIALMLLAQVVSCLMAVASKLLQTRETMTEPLETHQVCTGALASSSG